MTSKVTPERAREVARNLGYNVPEPEVPADPEDLAEIADRYGLSPDLLNGRSLAAAEHLAAAIYQHTHPEEQTMTHTTQTPSTAPTAEERRAAEAAAREADAVEQHPAVIAAREAAEAAATLLTDLERRVVNGDQEVTVDDTGNARERARFAQLKLSAARRSVRDEREGARRQALEDSITEARTALAETHPLALEEKRQAALAAVSEYLTAIGDRNKSLRHAHTTFGRLGLPRHDGDWAAADVGDHHAVTGYDSIRIDSQPYEPLAPAKELDYVMWKASTTTGVGGPGGRPLRVEAKSTVVPNAWK
ncbi:hypothetical protein [Streptomyces sp. VNUA24]|uniref:hypothetical protein n=1 Tax=Streptomyces sp. VNUA24 TaxID=3031131 RepID=UPI0023B78250|nr:hypothetical protein [Streptomyces sp. VNUA24]WEH16859.1 hypothetical protein PYR72_25385 [Streptomyces sp. VNUA24]